MIPTPRAPLSALVLLPLSFPDSVFYFCSRVEEGLTFTVALYEMKIKKNWVNEVSDKSINACVSSLTAGVPRLKTKLISPKNKKCSEWDYFEKSQWLFPLLDVWIFLNKIVTNYYFWLFSLPLSQQPEHAGFISRG